MVRHAQVKEFVGDDEILKAWRLVVEIAASVIVPAVEHDPHFRVIVWTRTSRGETRSLTAHASTRRRNRWPA